jgi:general secretion pathway protein D
VSEAPPATPSTSKIPEPVRKTPFVPAPVAEAPVETYTVVVNDVPVKELLFALARDASINVDIHPDVSGMATLNAVDQSLTQILDRVSRQLDLRYEIKGGNVSIQPDTPFVRVYRVDYVNLSRQATTTSTVATNIESTSTEAGSSGGGGGNNSTTTVTSSTDYPFWDTLADTIRNLVSGSADPNSEQELNDEETVIANAANGVLMVRATGVQHEEVQRYLDEVRASSRRQVLIEATIVEVELTDNYQAGIDWTAFAQDSAFEVGQQLSGASGIVNLVNTGAPRFIASYTSGDLTASVTLLKQFGDTQVMSSPKVMALNNQTALLKVVENVVYFEVSSNTTQAQTTAVTTFNTTAKSVSVVAVSLKKPQVSDTDEVTLTVRPTISRVVGEAIDPNPALTAVQNKVPEIAVREMESVLRIGSGQLAVLGGLMQDDNKRQSEGIPWLSDSDLVGDAFQNRNNSFKKTELVIFLRPWVIQTPDVRADLKSFEPFLPQNIPVDPQPATSRFQESKDETPAETQ